MDTDEKRRKDMEQARKFFGFVVAVIIIFFAQRDLRRRPAGLVRGSRSVWKVVAMVPPGAVAYLLFGRRRSSIIAAIDSGVPIAA
jgi:hypothetical protein